MFICGLRVEEEICLQVNPVNDRQAKGADKWQIKCHLCTVLVWEKDVVIKKLQLTKLYQA